MKYIKMYERAPYRAPRPDENEYVVCQDLQTNDPTFGEYLKTAIGRILLVNLDSKDILVTFDDMPEQLVRDHDNTLWFLDFEILHSAKNKEDLRIYVDANKYNL